MPKHYGQPCPVARALEFLGERWTLLIIRDLLSRSRKFQDLQTSLRGIAATVLSHRLRVLRAHGIVERRLYSARPPRGDYALTLRGRELGVVVAALAFWGSRHVQRDAALVHDDCDGPIEVSYYCATCGERIHGGAVRLRTGLPRPGDRRSPRRARRAGSARDE
ncbi:MAG: helix-turn-helix transcriptional regulator [Acidobacteria bacterium]|nr:helix-turn-helix transcriptional regulator [Acidobacteriota bacterium]